MKTSNPGDAHHARVRTARQRVPRAAGLFLVGLCLAACTAPVDAPATTRPVSPEDALALSDVRTAAIATAAKGDPAKNTVECWVPSEHLIEEPDSSIFRIICRVHYQSEGTDRYIDLTCVGDFELEPMLDHCYPWLYYTEVPSFEDAEVVWAIPQSR